MLDEVEKGRLGPLQVVEIDDERPLRRFVLEELPKRQLRLDGRSADDAVWVTVELDQGPEVTADELAVAVNRREAVAELEADGKSP